MRRRLDVVAIELNHTIVAARDRNRSARFHAALLGLACGGLFALSAVGYRGGALSQGTLLSLVTHFGFTLRYVQNLPRSVRSIQTWIPNCSSVTVLGIVWVMEMGRWREKKLDRPRAALLSVFVSRKKKSR
jgi:hypothetical protein